MFCVICLLIPTIEPLLQIIWMCLVWSFCLSNHNVKHPNVQHFVLFNKYVFLYALLLLVGYTASPCRCRSAAQRSTSPSEQLISVLMRTEAVSTLPCEAASGLLTGNGLRQMQLTAKPFSLQRREMRLSMVSLHGPPAFLSSWFCEDANLVSYIFLMHRVSSCEASPADTTAGSPLNLCQPQTSQSVM